MLLILLPDTVLLASRLMRSILHCSSRVLVHQQLFPAWFECESDCVLLVPRWRTHV